MHPEQNTEALYDLYLALEKILSTHQGEGKGELRSDVPKTILCRILVSHFIGVITVWCMLNASFDLANGAVTVASTETPESAACASESPTSGTRAGTSVRTV